MKAAVVMTGDDHANGGTMGRFNKYISLSSSNTPSDVANWNAIRSTSYMYPYFSHYQCANRNVSRTRDLNWHFI